ncbi:hypothetical protein D3C87_1712770 [compost metagenome]
MSVFEIQFIVKEVFNSIRVAKILNDIYDLLMICRDFKAQAKLFRKRARVVKRRNQILRDV